MTPPRSVQSVARTLDVLEVLARHDALGLTEIAEQAQIPHNTAHRLLATLVSRGYVRRAPDSKRYQLGHAAARLGAGLGRLDGPLRAAARPSMEAVHKVCHESTNLVVLDGNHVVYVDQIAGDGSMRMFAEPGARVPAHASGAGKAMLAMLAPEEVDALLDTALERFTDHTIVDHQMLHTELAAIRQAGFALDREEYELAVSCVAAPIVRIDGGVAGALSVSGPTGRLGDVADYDALGELVGRSALAASRLLGFQGPSQFDVVNP